MPIYEFRCEKCNNVFERLCFHSDKESDITCPSCGGKDTEKLLSAFSSPGDNSSAGQSCAPNTGFS